MNKTLFLLVGTPGCGKSTYAKKEIAKYMDAGISVGYVSRDEVRFSMVKEDEEYFSRENEVFNKFIELINASIEENMVTIADATHLNEASREKVLRQVRSEDLDIVPVFFRVPLEICLERNDKREGRTRVPASVVAKMNKTLTNPFWDNRQYAYTITVMEGERDDFRNE